MKNKHIFIPLFVFIGACVVSLAYSIIDYKVINKQPSYSYQTVQFNYDGASDGKDPNGNPFDAVSFLTDDIIEEALTTSGLSYKVEDVRDNIIVTNVVPKNIVEEIESYESVTDKEATQKITSNDYHPTRYKFTLYQDLDTKLNKQQLNGLLNNVVESYCNKFYNTYKKTYNGTVYEALFAVDDYDYIFQSQIYSSRIAVLMDYARTIYNEHNDFRVDERTFNDIYLAGNQIIRSYVNRIDNLITLNALSTDLPRLKSYYQYKIDMLQYDKTKYTADLATVSAQVTAYEKDATVYVGTGENTLKIESSSGSTYTGLLAQQIDLANKLASIDTEIAEYTAILDDIDHAASTQEDYDLVESYLTRLGESFGGLEKKFGEFIDEYNKAYLKDGTSKNEVKYQNASIFSTSFITHTIKAAAPIMLATMLGIAVYYLTRAIKLEKKQ